MAFITGQFEAARGPEPERCQTGPMERIKSPKKPAMLHGAAALALILAGCGGETDTEEAPAPATTEAQTEAGATRGSTDIATGGAGSTPAQDCDGSAAVETAIAAVAGSAAIELDYSDRRQAREVDVISGDIEHEVRVSPDGNEVIEQRESGPAESEDVTDLGTASVLMSDAIGTALAEVPGHVEEASLDDEEDMPVWEIEVEAEDGSTTDLLIDAVSGKRIR